MSVIAAVVALLVALVSFPTHSEEPRPPIARVIGGSVSPNGAYPWMGALLVKYNGRATDEQICGVSLIAPQYALTAAHCVFDSWSGSVVAPETIDILLGQNRLSSGSGMRVAVRGILIHPRFDPYTLLNDFAIVKLETPVSYVPLQVASPLESELYTPGTLAKVLGWGRTDPKYYVLPDTLREASVPVVDDAVCLEANGRFFDPTLMVCAGDLTASPAPDTCNGDSGGPLVVTTASGEYRQVGVVSWGFACSSTSTYGVYSRVAAAADFISSRPVFAPRPLSHLPPVISGATVVGGTLSASVGGWSGDAVDGYQYQWYLSEGFDSETGILGSAIAGATSPIYVPTSDDGGEQIFVAVTAFNKGGSSVAFSDPVEVNETPVSPQLTPVVDTTPPIIKSGGRACNRKQCTQYIVVDDGKNSSGISSVLGRVRIFVPPTKDKRGKRVKGKAYTNSLQSSQFIATGWTFSIKKVKNAKYRLYVSAIDGAGNVSKEAVFVYKRL